VIEDRLTGGRLELQVHEKPKPMSELVREFAARPFHLVIVFDEAGVSIRRHGMTSRLLPMSPFCVRKTIRYDEHRNVLRLVPSTDDPPFADFMQLVNEAESGQRDSTPQTWADAENLGRSLTMCCKETRLAECGWRWPTARSPASPGCIPFACLCGAKANVTSWC